MRTAAGKGRSAFQGEIMKGAHIEFLETYGAFFREPVIKSRTARGSSPIDFNINENEYSCESTKSRGICKYHEINRKCEYRLVGTPRA